MLLISAPTHMHAQVINTMSSFTISQARPLLFYCFKTLVICHLLYWNCFCLSALPFANHVCIAAVPSFLQLCTADHPSGLSSSASFFSPLTLATGFSPFLFTIS